MTKILESYTGYHDVMVQLKESQRLVSEENSKLELLQKEYRDLKKTCEERELLSQNRNTILQNEYNALENAIKTQKEKIKKYENRIHELSEDTLVMTREVNNLEVEFSGKQSLLIALDEQLKNLESRKKRQLAEFEETFRGKDEKMRELKEEIYQKTDEFNLLFQSYEDLKRENELLQQEIKDREKNLNNREQDLLIYEHRVNRAFTKMFPEHKMKLI